MMVFSGGVSFGFQASPAWVITIRRLSAVREGPAALSFLEGETISLKFPPRLRLQVGRKCKFYAFLKHSPLTIPPPIHSDMTT